MTAVNKKYILLLALRTIIKRMKRKRLQRNNKRRYWVQPLNLLRGKYGCFNPFFPNACFL